MRSVPSIQCAGRRSCTNNLRKSITERQGSQYVIDSSASAPGKTMRFTLKCGPESSWLYRRYRMRWFTVVREPIRND